MRVMFGGDVMLGRYVDEFLQRYGPEYPLGRIGPLTASAGLVIANLECAITGASARWPGAPKGFYFRASPPAVHALLGGGIHAVSLANNHVLDFGVEGLRETIGLLRRHGIRYAGAGENANEAWAPLIVERGGMRFGMTALCDHQEDFAAGADTPGIAWLRLDDDTHATAVLRGALAALRRAAVDWPILSLHWGSNMVFEPSAKFRALARAAIDMGWRIVFGHSAHVFHGIELRGGYPIIYAAGDLVDDYRVDPAFRNDHQLLFELELAGSALRRIILHPLFIENCQARPAAGMRFEYVAERMEEACAGLGTRLRRDGQTLWIDGAA